MRDDRSLVGWFVLPSSSDPLSLITEDESKKQNQITRSKFEIEGERERKMRMRPRPKKRQTMVIFVVALALSLVLISLLMLNRMEDDLEREVKETNQVAWWRQQHPQLKPAPRLVLHNKEYSWKTNDSVIQYDELNPKKDAEWLAMMRHGTIVSIEPNFLSGASEKYGLLISFSSPTSGTLLYRAVAKPATNVRSPKWPNYTLPLIDFYNQ